MARPVYAVMCDGEPVYVTDDYDAAFARRESITECDKPHPIVTGRFVAGYRA